MDTRFVLITAAKNEERYIENTLQSVICQTVRPFAWYIVDDGSTDRTAEIVRRHASQHDFIRLICRPGAKERSFGAQYRAINSAYELARAEAFSFVAMQDADISLADDTYYAQVLDAFRSNSLLGVAGGAIFERQAGIWRPRPANSPDAVAGGIQMFRRACFDQLGGYTPLLFGGEDWLAQIEAKRRGWQVTALPELAAHHYRPTSSADGRLRGLFRLGLLDGSFGSHPAFEMFKCARRVRERPVVLSSVVRFAGYCWWKLTRGAPLLPPDASAFLRQEQVGKLRALLSGAWPGTARTRRT